MKKLFTTPMTMLMQFLFYDFSKKRMSHTKLWSNIGYGAMVYTFVYAVMYGSKIDIMLWALFGLVVVGNRTVLELMGRKNGNGNSNDYSNGGNGSENVQFAVPEEQIKPTCNCNNNPVN